jgi:hypothetical protein
MAMDIDKGDNEEEDLATRRESDMNERMILNNG